jgi:hypothetical protein
MYGKLEVAVFPKREWEAALGSKAVLALRHEAALTAGFFAKCAQRACHVVSSLESDQQKLKRDRQRERRGVPACGSNPGPADLGLRCFSHVRTPCRTAAKKQPPGGSRGSPTLAIKVASSASVRHMMKVSSSFPGGSYGGSAPPNELAPAYRLPKIAGAVA